MALHPGIHVKTARFGKAMWANPKAHAMAPRGPGAHRIRGPCGSHSQPPSHWQQYSTGGLILRILNRRLDLNNRLHLGEPVCTHALPTSPVERCALGAL